MNSYFQPGELCEKCQTSESKHRFQFGYVQCGHDGAIWNRYWHLCTPCMKNAKIATEKNQHPVWNFLTNEDGKGTYLKRSDKTIWPESMKGQTYGHKLDFPHG